MLEAERYELFAGPAYRFDLERRDFFKLLGGGLLLLLALENPGEAQESGRGRGSHEMPQNIAAWLHIGEDGAVTVFTGKTEVGQNIRTSLAQAVADELRTPIASIKLVMADTDLTPYDMGTFGSRTTPTMAPQLRKMAAAARETLIDLAAAKWKVDRAGIVVSGGRVKHDSQSASFGELTHGQQLTKTVDGAAVTPADQWTVAGTSVPKTTARDMVTGAHKYTSDMTRPNMLLGRVLRPAAFNAKLASLDTIGAAAIENVKIVRDGEFVGAVAADDLTLEKAIGALKAEWKSDPQPSSKDLFAYLKSHPAGDRGRTAPELGSVEQGFKSSDFIREGTYTVAYIAHTPLEPRDAVAEWKEGKLTVWTGTQVPFGVRSELAEAFGIPENHVRVIVPDTGSGYGGKHTGEAAIEAARLAKSAAVPVKVIWTREEEFTWAYFRPAGVIDVRGGTLKDGSLAAWEFHNYNSGGSGIETPYDGSEQEGGISCDGVAAAAGIVSGPGGHGESFRARIAHGRPGGGDGDGSAGIPVEESEERPASGGAGSGGGEVRLDESQERRHPGLRAGVRGGEGRVRGVLRRGVDRGWQGEDRAGGDQLRMRSDRESGASQESGGRRGGDGDRRGDVRGDRV